MKKYISFGECNKLYRHIWFYVFTKYVYDYTLSHVLEAKANTIIKFPKDILIQQAFNYSISFIGSIFLFFYENKQEKQSENELNKSVPYKKRNSRNNLELIQNEIMVDKNLSISDYLIILFLFLCIQLNKVFFVFGLKGLNYWMLEIFFIALINLKLFNIPISKHKKLGIFIIIFFCTLFKIISTIYKYNIDNNDNPKLYELH